MANIVQNAVGTQRQFTRQPVATYQTSLRNLVASQGITKSGAGDRLYNTLIGLGDTAMKYASSEEDRARAKTVDVEPLINAATDDDWKKLSAIELLNKYGKFQLADNPYAVATIEQARGKYMSEKFNQNYSLLKAQNHVEDPAEERQRYTDEKNKFLKDNIADSYDTQQFYKGFWESNPQDILNITNEKVAEKSKSLDIIGRSALQAQAATYISENADKSPEDYVSGLQKLINSSTLMSYQVSDRKAMLEGVLKDTATELGSPDKIRQCGNIIITNNSDGTKPILVKDIIDLNPFIRMAEDTALARPNEWTNQQYEIMAKCNTVDELDNWWNKLSPESQHMMQSQYGKYRVALVREVKIKNEQMIRDNRRMHKEIQESQSADISLNLAIANKADNTYCSADKAYDAATRKLATISPGDTNTFAKVLFWAPNSRMRSEYKNYFQQGIFGASANEMGDSSNPKSVTNAIALYKYNPALFSATFGKSLASDIQTISALIDAKGSPEEGFKFFCEGRDNMARSEQLKKDAESFASNAMSAGYAAELIDANNPSTNVSVPITSDTFSNVSSTALKYLRACTLDESAAKSMLQFMLNKNYVVYAGNPMPKAVFAKKTDATNGIDASTDQYGTATKFMNYKVENANAAWSGMHSTWWWGVDDKLHFGDPSYGFDEHDGYTLDEFYDMCNQWYYDAQASEEAKAASDNSSNSSSNDSSSGDSGSSYTTDDGGVVTSTGSHRATYSDWSWNGH